MFFFDVSLLVVMFGAIVLGIVLGRGGPAFCTTLRKRSPETTKKATTSTAVRSRQNLPLY